MGPEARPDARGAHDYSAAECDPDDSAGIFPSGRCREGRIDRGRPGRRAGGGSPRMTYLDDRETDRENPELSRRGRHSHDDADATQYVYERPVDWKPRRRRSESFEDLASYEAPTDATPVDWWAGSSRRGEGSAWDADALSAAAGVPYRHPDRELPDRGFPDRQLPGYPDQRVPEQRRPADETPDLAVEAPRRRSGRYRASTWCCGSPRFWCSCSPRRSASR